MGKEGRPSSSVKGGPAGSLPALEPGLSVAALLLASGFCTPQLQRAWERS